MAPSRPEMYTKNGLDWDFIRADYLAKCSPEMHKRQLESLARPMRELVQKPPSVIRSPGAGLPSNAISKEQDRIITDLYNLGNKVPFIAENTGISEATIRKHLRDAGVYNPNRDRGKR